MMAQTEERSPTQQSLVGNVAGCGNFQSTVHLQKIAWKHDITTSIVIDFNFDARH
jgi:hypothetical protein